MDKARRLRLVCFILAGVYLAVAAGRLAIGLAPLAEPAASTARIHCQPMRCWTDLDPVRLLEPVARDAVQRDPAGPARLSALLERPGVRATLAAGEALRAVPAVLLYLFLALAFRQFARGHGMPRAAIPWLRRAAGAALLAVLVQPVADTLRMTALSPVAIGRQQWHVAFNGGPFLWGLLLAGAVWVAVWALEQAGAVEAELAEIV